MLSSFRMEGLFHHSWYSWESQEEKVKSSSIYSVTLCGNDEGHAMSNNLLHASSESTPSLWFLESMALRESTEASTEFPDRSNKEEGPVFVS